MVVDAGSITSWPPGVVAPPGTLPDAYPYSGWTGQWQGTAGEIIGYGGVSQNQAPQISQYSTLPGEIDLVWTDLGEEPGNINVMAFDSNAIAVIAGDAALVGASGGLIDLTAGRTFAVNTTIQCDEWSGPPMARFRLVAAVPATTSGADTFLGPNNVANPSGAAGDRTGWLPKDWDPDSTFDTDVAAWFQGSSCSVAWTGAENASGSGGAMAITRLSTTGTAIATRSGQNFPVTPGQVVTGRIQYKAATEARTAQSLLSFYDSAGASLTSTLGTTITETTTGWTEGEVTATAPAGAATAGLTPEINGVPAGEVHYVDDVKFDGSTPIPVTQSVASPGVSPPAATSIKVQSGPSAPVFPGGYFDTSYAPILPGVGPLRVRVSLDVFVESTDGSSMVNIYRGDGVTSSSGDPLAGHGTGMLAQAVHYNDGWVHIETDFDTTAAFPYVLIKATATSPTDSDVAVHLTNYSVRKILTVVTTESATLTSSGPLSWTFAVPADASAAYLAVESLTGDPAKVVRFSKPVVRVNTTLDTAALGYLGSANAVPLRLAQIRMPAYYRKDGWPTKAKYLLAAPGDLSFTPSVVAGSVGRPTVVDPRSIATAADLRFLASQNYSQAAGTWAPWKSSGVHAMTLRAMTSEDVPYYASAVDNLAFSYQLSATQRVSIPSLSFNPGVGCWLYSDEFDALGLTAYTVLAVLSLSNHYQGRGGIWSSVPVASGGGPDTAADLEGPPMVNYRAVDSAGPAISLDSAGMQARSFPIGNAALVHKPTYLAMTFSNTQNSIYYADSPGSMMGNSVALGPDASGPLVGSVVLGADATRALAPGSFDLFELNIYFAELTAAEVQREIGLLGQVYC